MRRTKDFLYSDLFCHFQTQYPDVWIRDWHSRWIWAGDKISRNSGAQSQPLVQTNHSLHEHWFGQVFPELEEFLVQQELILPNFDEKQKKSSFYKEKCLVGLTPGFTVYDFLHTTFQKQHWWRHTIVNNFWEPFPYCTSFLNKGFSTVAQNPPKHVTLFWFDL